MTHPDKISPEKPDDLASPSVHHLTYVFYMRSDVALSIPPRNTEHETMALPYFCEHGYLDRKIDASPRRHDVTITITYG